MISSALKMITTGITANLILEQLIYTPDFKGEVGGIASYLNIVITPETARIAVVAGWGMPTD
jgi:hypothetical protein